MYKCWGLRGIRHLVIHEIKDQEHVRGEDFQNLCYLRCGCFNKVGIFVFLQNLSE